jgi:hypothetical protein
VGGARCGGQACERGNAKDPFHSIGAVVTHRSWLADRVSNVYTVPVYRISFTRACVWVWVCLCLCLCAYRVVRPFQIVPRHIVHVYKLHRSRVLAKSVITTIIGNGYRAES